jgi:hypothetical protein
LANLRLVAANSAFRGKSGHDILRRGCPLLAQSRHELVHCTCPLSGVKRTMTVCGNPLSRSLLGAKRHCACPLMTQSGHPLKIETEFTRRPSLSIVFYPQTGRHAHEEIALNACRAGRILWLCDSGAVGSSHGEKFEKNGELLKPGSLWVYPAKHAHYAWTGSEEGVLQVQYIGPGGINYVNPADDPRKK